MKKKIYLKKGLFPICGILFLLISINSFGQCPAQYAIDGIVWFGTLDNAANYDTSQPLGSYDNPLTDWNSGSPSVLEAITDCAGPIRIEFRECYYNTDAAFGDVNWVDEALNDNVTLDGNGALLESDAAGVSFLELLHLNNWLIQDFTFTGYNNTDGGVLGIFGSQNVTIDNVIFDSNPTTTPVHIDNAGSFDGFMDATVTISNSVFSNNPPGAETVSTGALEIEYTSSGTETIDVDVINTVFSCNKRAGYGGAVVIIGENGTNTTKTVSFTNSTFSGNLAFGTAGEGGAIYASGEDWIIDIDNTTFSCNEAQATTGTGSGGGAIRVWDGPQVNINNSIFYGNIASTTSGDGGAIAYSSSGPTGPFTITNSSFIDNTAANGGAIWTDETITLTDAFASNNTPQDYVGVTNSGTANTTGDGGIAACPACFAVAPPGCDASGSDLALTCDYFCSTGVPPAATGDADLTIDMSNFIVPNCSEPLDYTYTFLVLDASGTVVCEFDATDATTQDAANGFATIAGPADGIPDAMDPAVQQANLCTGLAPGDYTIVGFHYLTADVPPIVIPFIGQTLTTIQNYLTNPPTDPVACGALGTETPFTVLNPIVATITTSCTNAAGADANPGEFFANVTITGGWPEENGSGTYTIATNFGTTTYIYNTPIVDQAIVYAAGSTVDVTVSADANGLNGTTPPGPLCVDCTDMIVSVPSLLCAAPCIPPDITVDPTFAEVCAGDTYDLTTATVTDMTVYPSTEAVTITYHSATPASTANLIASSVSPTVTTTYYILATSDNATPGDVSDDCTDEIPFTVIVDTEAPMINCPVPFTIPECADIADYPPAIDLTTLNDSVEQICVQNVSINFGSTDGTFAFPDIGSGDIANHATDGSNLTNTASFDIFDETTGTMGPGGANDITFEFELFPDSDAYGGMVLDPLNGTTHDIQQSTSGVRGNVRWNQTSTVESSTGDISCYNIKVSLASHVKVEAQNFTALVNSVNTCGEVYETTAIVFLDDSGNPFGSADYAGYYSSPPTGVPGGANPPMVNGTRWNVSGTGVYLADDNSNLDITTDIFNPECSTTSIEGPASTFDPIASTDGGLAPSTPVSGVIFQVCYEDVAATTADGDETSSMTQFTATLNGFDIAEMCFNSAVCDNGPLDNITITSNDEFEPLPFDPTVGGCVNRTYYATDACGNIDSCIQKITIPACISLCPDIVDGTLAATANAAPATDVCSGDMVSVCVDVDLTNDATAIVEFSNDGGATWTAGTATSATQFCATFTETNTTCDPVAISYQAQFNLASLVDMTCDQDLQTMDATPSAVTVNVYPDMATAANAVLANDGACGPSLTQNCPNFTVTNTYDANGATPDFSAEINAGSLDFTITNAAAPLTCQTVVVPATYSCLAPDLTITKSNSPTGIVSIGDTITYTVTVMNIGTGDATNVILTDAAPANTTLIAGSLTETTALSAMITEAAPNVSATLGTLSANATVTITFQVTVDAGTPDGTIIPNIATVDSDETDPEDSPEVVNVVELPELDIVKSNAPQGVVEIGDVITYTVVVTNNGTGDAHNVIVTDMAPTNTTLVGGSLTETTAIGATLLEAAPTITADQFDLDAGQSITITFQVTVDAGTPGGTLILNTANVDSDETDPEDSNEVNNEVEDPFPSINMDKDDADNMDDMQTVSNGDDATFTITVTNDGTEDLCNVSVTDPNGAACEMTYTDNGGILIVGDTWTYTCIVPNATTSYVNTAIVNAMGCNSMTPVTDDDPSTVFVPVADVPSVTVDKNDADNMDDMQTVSNGDDATFTITVTNDGTEDLCNVSVTDPNGAACEMTYTDNGGILVVGDTWTYTCIVPNATTSYVNTAIVNAMGCNSMTPVTDDDPSTVFVPVADVPSVTVDKNDADNGDDAQTINSGGDAVFTITVTNDGTEDLCNVSVTDPNGAACNMTYTDNGGILVVGDTWTYTCTVSGVAASFTNTAIVNAMGCTSMTPVTNEDPSCVTVEDPVLDALKTSEFTDANGDGLLNPGEVITYSIVVTNYGTADALNVMFNDAIPAGTTLLGNESTTLGTISSGTNPVTANLGTLTANGGTATITFQVTVDANTADGFIIMNQGVFTADNHPDVPTDDPNTPDTPDDPTTDPVVDPSCQNANNGLWNH